jgi:hypothetical protein
LVASKRRERRRSAGEMALKRIRNSIIRAGVAKNEAKHQKRVRVAKIGQDSVEIQQREVVVALMAYDLSHVKA